MEPPLWTMSSPANYREPGARAAVSGQPVKGGVRCRPSPFSNSTKGGLTPEPDRVPADDRISSVL
jgi:hypothetical protein